MSPGDAAACFRSERQAKMLAMTFRVYLRWPGQRVSDKTVTENRTVAELAYRELLARADLVGKSVAAALTKDGKQLAYHQFDGPEGSS
ncbi:MAG: hypothetical protein WCA12_09465 [Burkholderiales bacterium]